ncbi:PAS domain-containing protein [Glacieibacterium sp.]|uniref:GAF domain-containing hybrid sensor histidine kinase/response regulator n=1 Tax=Glacieibacterium sp. TaxID=2860237 RepID=UPI003B00D0D1
MSPAVPVAPSSTDFLRGGGVMGALMRVKDWTATSLGPVESWPQTLRTAIRLMLNTGHPMYIFWGAEGACLYNDAYSASIGPERHPASLGQPARQVWAEIWDIVGPQFDQVMAGGEATWNVDALVPITRHGRREDVYWTYSYGPIDDVTAPNGVGGVLVVCSETTGNVVTKRHLAAEQSRQHQLFEGAPGFICILQGPGHVYEFVNHAYRQMFGRRDYLGRSVVEVFPEVVAQGVIELLDQVYATGEQYVASQLPISIQAAGEPGRQRYLDFIYAPTVDENGTITGIFCEGFDVTEAYQARQVLLAVERRHAFLVDLGDALRDVGDADRIMRIAAEALGRHLEADRVGYGEVDENGEVFTIVGDWAADGMPVFAGTHRFDTYGPAPTEILRRGGVSRLEDIMDITPLDRVPDAYDAVRARASLAVPLNREGRFAALMYVHSSAPRKWSTEDEALIQNVAERTWASVERARVEAALRTSEEQLRALSEALELQVAERTAALQASEASMRGIFETSFQSKGVLSPDGIIVDINGTALRTIDATYDAIVGKLFWETPWFAATAGSAELVRSGVGRAASGTTVRFTMHLELPAGWRWFDASLRPIHDTDGQVFAIVAEALDITERRQAEEALRQSQKLEAMGQLTGGVAHDFNNLLTPIIGSLDMLQRRGHGGEREQRLIDGALLSAERAKTLVQRLLAFARRQPLQPVAVDVASRIIGMQELIASTVGPRVAIHLSLDEGLPAARADPNQLEMALLNLSVNARDAMPDGGTLTIAATAQEIGEDRRHGLRPATYVRVCVSDTGVGMDKATLARAIEPFFSTKGIGQGTGLGLSMVHGLASQLGGAMAIVSHPGEGTTVEFWLPVAGEALNAAEASPAATVPVRPAAGVALLVDDEQLVRASTADMLTELGYHVVEASSTEAALALLDNGGHFDVLVTDHLMPGTTGAVLAAQFRDRYPDRPVLVISGYADFEGIPADLPRLTKPFRLSELADTLAGLTRGGSNPAQ